MEVRLNELAGAERLNAFNLEPKLSEFGNLLQAHFFGSGLELNSTAECDLLIQTREISHPLRMHLHFDGVRLFHFRQHDLDAMTAIKLAILDIRDRQWDMIRYEVTDKERGAISFICADVNIRSLERL